jgi:hypothetical protein
MHPKSSRDLSTVFSEAVSTSAEGPRLPAGEPTRSRVPRGRHAALSFDLSESTKQLAEHACALWIEAAMLTHLAKEHPWIASHPIALMTKRAVEVCRLAQTIRAMATGRKARSRHSPGVPRVAKEKAEAYPEGAD